MKFIVMGSGTSNGVPVIGCPCPVCASADERDKRTRASLYIKGNNGERIVIDTGPEFRLQALSAGIKHLDFVLLTHSHADHLHGLDDLRPLSYIKPMQVYGNEQSINDVRERFAYIWRKTQKGGGKPRIDLQVASSQFSFENITITPVPVRHGNMDVLGWKIRENTTPPDETASINSPPFVEAAYITDCNFISAESLNLLKNISCLIIGAPRAAPHETHFSFSEALETVKRIDSPLLRQVFFTHITDDWFHTQICEYCKRWREKNDMRQIIVLPAFDGMEISF
ncbi:MAG: MBL fold metallo-hydrolase [Spirochaetaceae bacterium]|jgi:phosphoribosyl 1,2-cyclic phosphate phosphodiesterase|nr:MBL fold metallo-hydrolase [Spirochaetaceae bacterium]